MSGTSGHLFHQRTHRHSTTCPASDKHDAPFLVLVGLVSCFIVYNDHKRCHAFLPSFAPSSPSSQARRSHLQKLATMTGTGKKGNTTKTATVEILQEHVVDLFARSGEKARLVLKYRHCDSKLSLRVTDDRKTAKYKTRRQAELGKIKRLVGLIITGKAGEEGLDGSGAGESPARSRKGQGKHKAKKG